MFAKGMKWFYAAVILMVALRLLASDQVLLAIVGCAAGVVVVMQLVRAGKYLWAAGFSALVLVLNPVVPLPLSGRVLLWLDWAGLALFLAAVAVLSTQPTLTVASIISRAPRRQSL